MCADLDRRGQWEEREARLASVISTHSSRSRRDKERQLLDRAYSQRKMSIHFVFMLCYHLEAGISEVV